MSGSSRMVDELESDEIESGSAETGATRPPVRQPELVAPAVTQATRAQRIALIAGVLVVGGLALELFASVLTPFVAAAVVAYALDPPATQLTRLGLRRGAA